MELGSRRRRFSFMARTLTAMAVCAVAVEGFMHGAVRQHARTAAGPPLPSIRPRGRIGGRAPAARDRTVRRQASSSDGADSEPLTSPYPADWRAFRAALIERGIQTRDELASGQVDDGNTTARWGGRGSMRRSVAPANEELLREQNPELAREYLEGVWAHEAGEAEAGGLLVRMPLEFELMTLMRQAQRHAVGYGRGGMSGPELALGHKLCSRLRDGAWDDDSTEDRMDEQSGNLSYVYELAGRLVDQELGGVIASVGGMRMPADGAKAAALSDDTNVLLSMYEASIDLWQVGLACTYDLCKYV